ncbi:CPA2 family monovalent cation:H+ antiporter-2 [Scopulibacillus daqui]|uniref:CPA2 family monovalent cation:H+ antiporter-2 n=1 Tax=Scopulibacillus daqui TaxID=1469162 RepID=A0ABS2PXK0_9BACL|nr:monovalent cation:proton antiporter family protein [Scopulibacillus daqui]MBM7644047.1 CPA2 family monovalent cation:H+ antiporter-2 [Scopulibacillus daqui]
MHTSSITSLIVVLIAAFFTPIVLNRLKLKAIPVVVAEIIAGLIIGKSGLDIVHHGPWIDIMSSFGFIFLMFLSGVEIDFSVFVNSNKREILPNGKREPNRFGLSMFIFILILIISFILSAIFVWMNLTKNVFFLTLVVSTISLGVVMPTLKENKLMKTGIGQIILLITVIADLATMILLAVFVSFHDPSSGNTWLLFILFGAGAVLYFIGMAFKRMSFLETLSKGTVQIGTRAVFALILLLVGVSETVGAENILGAFIAGVLVSLLSPNKEMVQQLDSFGYGFFIPIFFVMTGVDLNIWDLFSDKSVWILIPMLFIALLISKLVPILVLKKWYDWKTVLGAGFLITSTLSLVVAAAKVGVQIHVIDQQMSSTLILLAVVTCLITPPVFKKIFPKQVSKMKKKLVFVGANELTLPLSLEMDQDRFETKMYHTELKKHDDKDSHFDVIELESYDIDVLKNADIFKADTLVITTGNEETNDKIARYAKEHGVERVIVRIETPEHADELRDLGIEVFSSYFSRKAMLKAIIESPSVVNLLTTSENGLYQIEVHNREYAGTTLRKFPFFGDTIIVRIFRDDESIVPHGDTRLNIGDKLIVTGGKEHVDQLRDILS